VCIYSTWDPSSSSVHYDVTLASESTVPTGTFSCAYALEAHHTDTQKLTPDAFFFVQQLSLRLLDEKVEVKAANGRLLTALHATLGSAVLDEAMRLNAGNYTKLRAQFPEVVLLCSTSR